MKSPALKAVFAPLLAMLMLLSSAVYASPSSTSNTSTDYRLSGQAWAKNYYDFFAKHHLKAASRLMLPQVWLFSPEGEMVRIAAKDTDPNLEKLAAAFPDSVGTDPLPEQPTSAQARAFLAQALSDQSVPAPKEGRWYAVLILLDRPAPHGCKKCAAYDKQLRAIQMKHSDILDTVRVTMALSR